MGGGISLFSKAMKVKIALGICLIYSSLMGSEQAILTQNQEYIIPKHSFSNEDVYNYNNGTFKPLQGTNYYGVKSAKDTSGITLIYDNPKTKGLNYKDPAYRLQVLTPDIRESSWFYLSGRRDTDIATNITKRRIVIPFIVAANINHANANHNTLILKNGELSSVIAMRPTDISKTIPKDFISQYTHSDIDFVYSITAARTLYGNSNSNNTYFKAGAIMNLGSQDDYKLKPNGVAYFSGATAAFGDAKDNTLHIEQGSKFYVKTTNYKEINQNEKQFGILESYFAGAGVASGNAINNSVVFDGGSIIAQGPEISYSTIGVFNIMGADINSRFDTKEYIAKHNKVVINNLYLDTKTYSKNKKNNYNAIVFGNIMGARMLGKGDVLNNSVIINDIESYNEEEKRKTQGYFNFYGGMTDDGEANNNSVEIELKTPLNMQKNFIGKHIYNFYGGYATRGASNNIIKIKNNFTKVSTNENYDDKAIIMAARTLKGKANNNQIILESLAANLPLYIYATAKVTAYGNDFFADEANNNKISLIKTQSHRSLLSIIEAKNVRNNKIIYNKVGSFSHSNSFKRNSVALIRGFEVADSNIININNYSSNSGNNAYLILGEKEAVNNRVLIENAIFGVNSGLDQGILKIFGGVGEKTHNNILSLKNIILDKFNKDERSVFIAASAIPYDKAKNSKSYNNTLYIGGNFETYQGSYIDVLSGAACYTINEDKYSKSSFAPSMANLTKGNHLILDISYMDARIVNNFEDYSFIISSMTDKTEPLLRAFNLPINLSNEAKFNLLVSDADLYKGEKIIAIESKSGFADINGNIITNKEKLDSLLDKINKNKQNFNYKKIPNLENISLRQMNFKLESSKDLKTLYIKIL